MMQAPDLIDDDEQWEIEEILDRTEGKKNVWYKVKWLGWGPEYNQRLPEKESNRAPDLIENFEQARRKRRRRK